jgi:hypothetical protein
VQRLFVRKFQAFLFFRDPGEGEIHPPDFREQLKVREGADITGFSYRPIGQKQGQGQYRYRAYLLLYQWRKGHLVSNRGLVSG